MLKSLYQFCSRALAHLWLLFICLAYSQAAHASFLNKMGSFLDDNIVAGNWITQLCAACIVICGVLFMFGRLPWVWAGSIIFGAFLVGGASVISDTFIGFF